MPKDTPIAVRLELKDKKICSQPIYREWKLDGYQQQGEVPCGRTAKWLYDGKYLCVECWKSVTGLQDD